MKLIAVLVGLLIVVSGYSIYATKQWGAEKQANDQLIEDLRSEREHVRLLKRNLQESNKLIAKVEEEKRALRASRAATQQEFEKNVENDPEGRAWRDTDLPAVVVDGLHNTAN
ncbi:MAG: hypothetical protein GTN99_08120 [Candidatus Dadabacteria bacterium]|nr:hypothetical protein [Candidatus Dadabacteria bacterium]